MRNPIFPLLGLLAVVACQKDRPAPIPDPPANDGPKLVLKFKFDSTQARLNAVGLPAPLVAGHGAQSPRFNTMSAHYVEFAPTAFTPLGSGEVVYYAPETTAGGANAIDFAQSVNVGDGGTFLEIPLSDLAPGSYEWLRVSLAYQNYNVDFHVDTLGFNLDLSGTIASFIGFNTYIADSFRVHDQWLAVNGNRLQGFWAFEVDNPPFPLPVTSGQAPGTTVPNPINDTSPIPAGSCVVTGPFAAPLVITGHETQDVVITVSLSTNKSFEWTETDGDNVWEPLNGETVTDMGIRGMVPIVQ